MGERNNWPADTDGDMLRILEERDFDFNAIHEVEFYIEFKQWPLSKSQQVAIESTLSDVAYVEPNEEDELPGHVLFKVKSKVTHAFVTQEQQRISHLVSNIDGYCNSWAVCSPCGT